jgi:hypothetical protein
VFLVLVAKAPATVWKVKRSTSGVIINLQKKTEYVNHYSFHLIDPEWGHVTVKMSEHPPFGAQVLLPEDRSASCWWSPPGTAFGAAVVTSPSIPPHRVPHGSRHDGGASRHEHHNAQPIWDP